MGRLGEEAGCPLSLSVGLPSLTSFFTVFLEHQKLGTERKALSFTFIESRKPSFGLGVLVSRLLAGPGGLSPCSGPTSRSQEVYRTLKMCLPAWLRTDGEEGRGVLSQVAAIERLLLNEERNEPRAGESMA